MKKSLCILIIILSTSSFSCKKFLQEENLSGLTSENYYVDAAGFEGLVNSCYASMTTLYNINPSLFEWGTDLTTRGEIELVSGAANEVPALQLNEYKTLSSDNPAVDNFFRLAYAGIQRTNTGLNKATTITGLPENLKSRRIAELRFIRAYYYYLLVENFGGVPIVEDEFSSPVTHFVPNTEQEVYSFIIKELTGALPNLEGDPAKVEPGRVTQTAVKHFLSLLYLTRGYKSFAVNTDFQTSAQLAEELISSPYHALLPSFADVFKPGNERNKEIIFSIQYEPLPGGAGHGQNIMFGWRYWRERGFDEVSSLKDYNRRRSDFRPTQFIYTLYNTTKDARYDATFLNEIRATKSDGAIKVGDLRFYFPYPDQTFSAADETVLKAANPQVEVIRFSQWAEKAPTPGNDKGFPMIKKFYDPNAQIPPPGADGASSKDLFLFRLAETYLIAAEAYFKMGQLDKAAQKLNAIRQRAVKAGQSLTISSADVTLDFILDEKAREMVGEYKRWLDLKRTRRLGRAFEQNLLTKSANSAGVIDKYYLRPIPQTVIDRDTEGYPQNPGY